MVTVRKRKRQASGGRRACDFNQGGRTVYTLIMDLGTSPQSIPPERCKQGTCQQSKSQVQSCRIQTESHLTFEQCPDWVLGTIILGIDPTSVEFSPFAIIDDVYHYG